MDLVRETWLDRSFIMPDAVSYAATVSLPEGVLVIGGEVFKGGPNGSKLGHVATFAGVFLMSFDPATQEVAYEPFPPLPAASSSGAAALLDRTVYYQTGKDFYALDLHRFDVGWRALPTWPGEPRDTAVALAVGGKVVIATGRTQADGVWHIHKDAFAFDPVTRKWEKLPDMPFPAMAGAGFGIGRNLVIVGGDKDVERWDLVTGIVGRRAKLETGTPEWEKLGAALEMFADHHLGFNTEILAYDMDDGEWSLAGRFPGAAPVTTQPVVWQGKLILTSGEIRPGVRSPKVWIGSVDD
jgi:N-acetylneuraminic acid mutarotase